jgi:hypothetical protein
MKIMRMVAFAVSRRTLPDRKFRPICQWAVGSIFEGGIWNRRVLVSLILLCSLGWAADNPFKLASKCKAGEQRSCQKLAEIATTDKDVNQREIATMEITDQAVLAQIAKNNSDSRVRTVAVRRLTDQGLLAALARTDTNPRVRKSAISKLTDQSVLADVVETDKDPTVAAVAAEQLTDQTVLIGVAKSHPDTRVREAAISNPNLTDQAVLAEIAQADSHWWLRVAAVARLNDRKILTQIAGTDPAGLGPEMRDFFPQVIREAQIRLLALAIPRGQLEQGAVLVALDTGLAIQVDHTASEFPVPVAPGKHSVSIRSGKPFKGIVCSPGCLSGCADCFLGNAVLRITSEGFSEDFSFTAQKGALYIVSVEERKAPRTSLGIPDPTGASYVLVFESRGEHKHGHRDW